jgi:hypothetical protein
MQPSRRMREASTARQSTGTASGKAASAAQERCKEPEVGQALEGHPRVAFVVVGHGPARRARCAKALRHRATRLPARRWNTPRAGRATVAHLPLRRQRQPPRLRRGVRLRARLPASPSIRCLPHRIRAMSMQFRRSSDPWQERRPRRHVRVDTDGHQVSPFPMRLGRAVTGCESGFPVSAARMRGAVGAKRPGRAGRNRASRQRPARAPPPTPR